MWENVFPSAELSQAIVNRVTDECDILVCIFYKRFYTRSGRIESENLNKYLVAYDSWKSRIKPHVMFYFKEIEAAGEGSSTSEIYEVNELKKKMKKENIVYIDEFSAPYEFCEKIYDHIEKWVRDNTNKH
jgi:hypothetical protein